MSERFDVWKSFVRGAAERAGRAVRGLGPFARAREAFREIGKQRGLVREEELTGAIAHAEGVRAASVQIRQGAVRVDVTFEDGEHLAASFVPLGARFAPRGAKEVLFRVEPPERASSRHTAEIVSAMAGAIARGLWSALVGGGPDALQGAIVERDGPVLRVDLRTVPAVRRLQGKGALGMVVDLLVVRAIRAQDGQLSIDLELPDILG